MKLKGFLLIALSVTAIIFLYNGISSEIYQKQANVQASFVEYKGISGLIRTDFTKFALTGNIVYAGDKSGQLSSWNYDDKKKVLTQIDTTRKVEPIINQNKILQILPTKTALLVVTQDGVAKVQKVDSNSKFTGAPTKIDIQESFSKIVLMSNENGTVNNFLTISKDSHDLCVYTFNNGLEDPNPVKKLECNHTTENYLDADYSSFDSVIVSGNAKAMSLFTFKDSKLTFVTSIFLPKSQEDLFGVMFPPKIQGQNKYILLVNGLWACSVVYDQTAPSAKILSSEKTQKYLKKGGTTRISINPNNATQKSVIANANGKVVVFSMSMKTGKLTYQNQSKIDGEISQFQLYDNDNFFRINSVWIDLYKVKDTEGGISQEKQFFQSSANHFNNVSALSIYQNYMVSTAVSGKYNYKLWKNSGSTVTQLDETTYSFFSILKSGAVNLKTLLMVPPKKTIQNLHSQSVTETLHIISAGTDPFYLILTPLTTSDKIGTPQKTKEQHSANVTVLLTTPNGSLVISAGMDYSIKLWSLDKERKNLTLLNTTIVKDGPISFGYNDPTGNKYIFSHSGNDRTPLANISIWQLDEKKQKFMKIAANSAGQASNSNFTAFLRTQDQKYFITMAENGELRQWQHNDWKSVSLVATLSTGLKNVRPVIIPNNRLLIQTNNKWISYLITDRGFVLQKQSNKSFQSWQTSNMVVKDGLIYSGDKQGCIRIYSLNQ